jgi:hypothetical protein
MYDGKSFVFGDRRLYHRMLKMVLTLFENDTVLQGTFAMQQVAMDVSSAKLRYWILLFSWEAVMADKISINTLVTSLLVVPSIES